MDGKGNWRDNVRMERFWRTYKYELFNLYDDVTLGAIEQRLERWIRYYNSERLHAALGNKTRKNGEKSTNLLPDPHLAKFCLSVITFESEVSLREPNSLARKG